jgi:hypothetical protein
MSIFTLTDGYVVVNGVTLSDHANQITVEDMRDQIDITAFGAANKAYTKGLGDAKITVQFFQDFAASKVHQTLQPLISSSSPVTIEVRPTSGARSTTNPAFVMSALLFDYKGLDGQVGQASTMQAEFINGSSTGLQYLTS